MSKISLASKNIIVGLIDKVILLILPFVVRTILLYYIGIEYVGLNSLFTSIFTVLNLSELGVGSAIVYQMYAPFAQGETEKINHLLGFYKRIYRYIGVFIGIAGLAITPVLRYIIKDTLPSDVNLYYLYFVYLCNTCLSYCLFSYKISILNVSQNTRIKNTIDLLILSCQYIVQIAIIVLTRKYAIYISVLPIFTILNNLAVGFYTKRKFPDLYADGDITHSMKKEIRSNILSLVGHKIGATVITSADNIVISSFLGLAILGKYNNYYYVMYTVITLLSIIYFALLPMIGSAIATKSKEQNLYLFYRISFFNTCIIGWCTVCILCLLQDFILLWTGEENQFGIEMAVLFAIDFYIWKIYDNVGLFKDAAGIWKQDLVRPYIASIVNVVTNIILVKWIGIQGIIISTIASVFFVNIPWSTQVLFKYYFAKSEVVYYKKQMVQLVATLSACIMSFYSCKIFHGVSILVLLEKVTLCTCITIIVYLLFFWNTEEYKYFLARIKKFLKG